jgi:hypothetical protein
VETHENGNSMETHRNRWRQIETMEDKFDLKTVPMNLNESHQVKESLFIRFPKLLLLVFVFIYVFGRFSVKVWDPDFWWHLKTGEYIYQTGALPQTDPFSFTSLEKNPLNPESKRIKFVLKQYWLAQLIFYVVYQSFLFQGIIFLRAGLLTLLVFLLFKAMRREGTEFFSSIFLIAPVSLFILPEFTGERPQLFSFLFFFLLLYLLDGFRKASLLIAANSTDQNTMPRSLFSTPALRLLPVPFIMLIWANLHGGFIVGILILMGYIGSETVKYFSKRFGPALDSKSLKLLLTICLLSILASFINPNGYNIFPALLEFGESKYSKIIAESKSPFDFMSRGYYNPEIITYLTISALGLLLLLLNISKADLTDAVICAGLLLMSARASRAIPFSTVYSTFIIAKYGLTTYNFLMPIKKWRLKFAQSAHSTKVSFIAQVAASLIIISLISFLYWTAKSNYFQKGLSLDRYPVGAARFLKANKIPGNMYNPYTWGGFLIWTLYPDYKVFIDGRGLIEEVFYQEGKIRGAHQKQLFGQPEWKAYLYAYDINFIITDSITHFYGQLVRLIPELIKDPEWHLIYIDNNSLIFLKDSPENSELINKFQMPKEWVWTEVIAEAASGLKKYGNNNFNLYITMGDAYLALGRYQNARFCYLKANEIKPQDSVVKQKLEIFQSRTN